MDDIQLLLYLIIGAIYIISRALKGKNKKQQPQARPQKRPSTQQTSKPAPTSFEDILAEFGKRLEEQQEEEKEISYEPIEEVIEPVQPAQPTSYQNEFEKEGRNRQFADEESRRVYEEAIVRAEGADIAFEANKKFHTPGLKMGFSAYEQTEKENKFAAELKEMLANPNETKKAIILSEILNRRY